MPEKEAFLKLSMVDQMLLIMDKGYTLLARKQDDLSIKLFELNNYFVEVKYHLKENKIISVAVVNIDDVSDDYLANIQIENLF